MGKKKAGQAKKGVSKPHRGRIQAQGGGTEKSVKWELDDPPTKDDVVDLLDVLWNQLTATEKKPRQICYDNARNYLLARTKPLQAIFSKSFTNHKLKGGIRIDIEVLAGEACS